MRLFLITSTPPLPTWGGAMAFYRHLCDRNDFQISVVTDNRQVLDHTLPYHYSLISHGPIWQRLCRTRLSQSIHSWSHLVGTWRIPPFILQQAQDFGADAIFTVAGSWSWTAKLAADVAKRLQLPLIGSFNDWWYYNSIRHTWLDTLLEHNFKQFYRQCDLAFCTSEGMRAALGDHPNAVILYPTGAPTPDETVPTNLSTTETYTIAFGGNLGNWYGHMLEDLVTQTTDPTLKFKFFGSNASWSESFDNKVKACGIYHGQVPFAQLRAEMQQVDALLLLMGFGQDCALIERTSFKTKFLDYLSFQKPILLWGPDYCSAVQVAQEFDAAQICTSPKAADFLDTIFTLKQDIERQLKLVKNAQHMYSERFHPDKIHEVFLRSIQALI